MAPPSFLTLPFELRYEIYQHYFTLEGGLSFQPGPGKLAPADGQPLDLALMYTCCLIANETKELPLRFNTVSFSTVYHKEWSAWAGRFHYQLDVQASMQTDLLVSMVRQVTPAMYSRIAVKFPWFVPMLKEAREGPVPRAPFRYNAKFDFEAHAYRGLDSFPGGQGRWRGYGKNASMVNQAVTYTLRLIEQVQGLRVAAWVEEEEATHDILSFLDNAHEPWEIPSWSELEAMGLKLDDHKMWHKLQRWRRDDNDDGAPSDRRYREKFRFSAAAVAIRFLHSLPVHTRLQLRKVVLHEDHVAVAHPERHAQGLIPFCKENPRLRIERRVDMVNTVLSESALHSQFSLPTSSRDDPGNRYQLVSWILTPGVAGWLCWALAAVDAGMPADAFTLVLDAGPAADLCSDILQRVVHRDLAWQTALERCYAQGVLQVPPSGVHKYTFSGGSQNFQQAVEHLVNQTSVLRCNFNPGAFWNVDEILANHSWWNLSTWYYQQRQLMKLHFDVLPPLPDLGDTLLENFEIDPKRAPKKGRRRRRVHD
ncbi:hypothetical protein ACHAPT_006629 [Fusarium lateritium]